MRITPIGKTTALAYRIASSILAIYVSRIPLTAKVDPNCSLFDVEAFRNQNRLIE